MARMARMTRYALRFARYILAVATLMATTAAINFVHIAYTNRPQG